MSMAEQNTIYRKDSFLPKRPKTYVCPRKIKLRSKVNSLTKRVRRMQRRISNMKDLIRTLKDKNLLSDEVNSNMIQMFAADSSHIFSSFLKNNNVKAKGRRYPMQFKHFALTLHYYSPKAYQFRILIH